MTHYIPLHAPLEFPKQLRSPVMSIDRILNLLGVGQPKLISISNECMIEKKGFDKKWSFRRKPTKK